MQFSKAEKLEYSQSQIIKKIQKLKLEVSSAEDYSKLEKCSKNLEKINEALRLHSDRKIRKQLRKMTEVCEGLIKQKTKYLKKKILQQLNASATKEKSQSKQKSLKYCRSVEAFPNNNEIFSKKTQPKRDDQQFWADKTEVQVRSRPRLQELVENLKDQVATYKMRINLLQSTANSIPHKMSQKQLNFEHEIGLKLKQKGLQIEQLKGKLKYHEQINQQLRNRLFNEQKRQQDYVDSLKSYINKLNLQVQRFQKDNKKLHDDLLRQIQLTSTLKTQIQRLLQLSDTLQREKRQRQQSEVLKMKDSGIRRELLALSQQERYMRQMEQALNTEKQQRLLKKQQLDRVSKKMLALQQQISLYEKQKQKLSELLQIRVEQISGLKKQLFYVVEQNKHRQEQLSLARNELRQCEIGIQRQRERKSFELTRKTQYLKRVKQLLN